MKKTYIIPVLSVVTLELENRLLADSYGVYRNAAAVTGENGGWAKDATTTSGYNVWDDDWSE